MGLVRLLLALAVVALHTQLHLFGYFQPTTQLQVFQGFGTIPVVSFFIISGFYMNLILEDKYLKRPNGVKMFYLNRFYRIFPVYFVMIFFSFIAVLLLNTTSITFWTYPLDKVYSHISIMSVWDKIFVFFPNIFIFLTNNVLNAGWTELGGWSHDLAGKIYVQGSSFLLFPPGWTLAIELLFYLIGPFFVRRKLLFLAIIYIVNNYNFWPEVQISTVMKYFIVENFRYFYYFYFGMISYEIYSFLKNIQNKKIIYFGYFCLAAIIILSIFSNHLIKDIATTRYIFATLIWISIPPLFLATKNSKLDDLLGKLSYPVYILHFIVYKILDGYFTISIFKYYITLMVSAALLVYLIEIPLQKYRQNLLNRKVNREFPISNKVILSN